MPTIASKCRSSFGTDCVQCGNELIAPERSEYRAERHVLHIWRCPKCDRSFEVIWSADSKSVTDISAFLIVLSAPISMKAAMAKLIIIIMTAALLTQNCYARSRRRWVRWRAKATSTEGGQASRADAQGG